MGSKIDTSKYRSNIQEKEVAEQIGGRVTIASGAFDIQKGDVRTKDYLIECKTTAKNFYSLTYKVWDKISTEALKDGMRIPVMCIDLEDGKYRFAVIQEGVLDLYDMDFSLKATESMSFRIRSNDIYIPVLMAFDQVRVNNRPLYLIVIPWNEFIERI